MADTRRTSIWRLTPPDRADGPVVEKPQQDGLERYRHVADLVEEEGAPSASLNNPAEPPFLAPVKAPSE